MEKKISLTRKDLFEVRFPLRVCFGTYDREECKDCFPQSCLRLCRKVTLFVRTRRI